uniref:Uncharacterized protein n=1 Tax=Glossina austeni TaxID=7395 RepID=A0A1A9UMG1_GLOAU
MEGYCALFAKCSNGGQKSRPTMAITISDGKLHNNKMVNKFVGFTANIIIGGALLSAHIISHYHGVFLLVTEIFQRFELGVGDVAVSNSLNLPCDIDDVRFNFFAGKPVPITDSDAVDCISGVSVCSTEV